MASHKIEYASTPLPTRETATGLSTILKNFLTHHSEVKFLRYQYIDYGAVVRARISPIAHVLRVAAENSTPKMGGNVSDVFALDGTILWDLGTTTTDALVPDWASLRECYYQPGHAVVMCCVAEGSQGPEKLFAACPRMRLWQLVNAAKQHHGVTFLVGVEVEFYIMTKSEGDGGVVPVSTPPAPFTTASTRNAYFPLVEKISDILEKAGIQVCCIHPESGCGMFELSVEPLPPYEAMDALVYIQETIKTVCSAHGFHATMHPRPLEKGSPAGYHAHISMSPPDKADSFLAGVLHHFRGLCGITMPTYDSYERFSYTCDYVSWGTENRLCAVRKIRDAYWEMRLLDGTAHPYLSLLAILAVGMWGISKKMPLEMGDLREFTAKPSEELRKQLHIDTLVPTSLREAIDALDENDVLKELLGPGMMDRYIVFKRIEETSFASKSFEERREIVMRYF
ncbi:hypothetical protein AJ80_03696 [Polytolypa hystricis UAMH7299]|uniref:GS catalytic domain-containing protein n=1 Tax=Polytolypa hystricis (strain UAMH7299) TaxID=1447883 RepID=A0A2B7YEU0_POLH7|nr:hypothetical protein AJ80_03696 [Polytolypa hystricis UAMH7299]